MATSVRISVEGAKDIDHMLATLPIELREKTLKKAMRKAVAQGRSDARAKAPAGSGVEGDDSFPPLKKAVKGKVTHARGNQSVIVGIVGTTVQAAQAHLVEFGHRMVLGGTVPSGTPSRVRKARDPSRTGKGRVVGLVAPHPWFRPAREISGPKIEHIILSTLAELTAKA